MPVVFLVFLNTQHSNDVIRHELLRLMLFVLNLFGQLPLLIEPLRDFIVNHIVHIQKAPDVSPTRRVVVVVGNGSVPPGGFLVSDGLSRSKGRAGEGGWRGV